MKLFPFTRVTQVQPSDQRAANGDTASPANGETPIKPGSTNDANDIIRSLRSGDRRQAGDRRRNDRAPSSVAVMFDTRTKTVRRRSSRRSEDGEQLQHFSIKI